MLRDRGIKTGQEICVQAGPIGAECLKPRVCGCRCGASAAAFEYHLGAHPRAQALRLRVQVNNGLVDNIAS